LKQEGIGGLYKGLTSTMAREMPGYFFFFGSYELSRHLLTPAGKTKDDIGNYSPNPNYPQWYMPFLDLERNI